MDAFDVAADASLVSPRAENPMAIADRVRSPITAMVAILTFTVQLVRLWSSVEPITR